MKNFESKLKDLSLRSPSDELDDRVLNGAREPVSRPDSSPWRIPLGWAVAASLSMGVCGFGAGVAWEDEGTESRTARKTPVTFKVVCDSTKLGDPFDLTRTDEAIQDPPWKTEIHYAEGGDRKD